MFGTNCGCNHGMTHGGNVGVGKDNNCCLLLLLLLCGCNGFGDDDNCCWNIILLLIILKCCGCGIGF